VIRSTGLNRDRGSEQRGPDLLVVDDCRLSRDGLVALIQRDFRPMTVRAVEDTNSLLSSLDNQLPDVILLNLASFDSYSMMQVAHQRSHDSKLIVLGVSEHDEAQILACAEAGVNGYHLRNASLSDLADLIEGVMVGDCPCSPRVAAFLLNRVASLAADSHPSRTAYALTQREIQIVRFLEMGLSNKEIATHLSIEVGTVKNHVHSLLAKLGVRRRAHAAAVLRGRTERGGSPEVGMVFGAH
jgi:DNA-binding NarL/FixJ family response regulator